MINLGDEVQDTITGFRGVALARMECLYEATAIRVHPRGVSESDQYPKGHVWLEEDRLTVVKEHSVVGFINVAGQMSGVAPAEVDR